MKLRSRQRSRGCEPLMATADREWGPVIGKSLIDRSNTITRLIERQDFLLQVTLAAQHLCLCGAPDSAIQTGQSMRAEIAFISQATRTDPKIQGVNVFNMTQAEGGVLPGMNVLASLLSDKIIDGITVPASAIVWWQDKGVGLSPHRFR